MTLMIAVSVIFVQARIRYIPQARAQALIRYILQARVRYTPKAHVPVFTPGDPGRGRCKTSHSCISRTEA